MADWRSALAHHPINIGTPPPGLPLVSLVLSVFHFKSRLKLFQWGLLTPAHRFVFPFETDVPHLLPAGLVLCRQTHEQNPKILPVTVGSETGIDLLSLPVSFLIVPCNCKDRGEHCLCSESINQSSQGPEVSPDCPWTSWCNFIAAYMKNQQRIIIWGRYWSRKFSRL